MDKAPFALLQFESLAKRFLSLDFHLHQGIQVLSFLVGKYLYIKEGTSYHTHTLLKVATIPKFFSNLLQLQLLTFSLLTCHYLNKTVRKGHIRVLLALGKMTAGFILLHTQLDSVHLMPHACMTVHPNIQTSDFAQQNDCIILSSQMSLCLAGSY